MRHELLLRCLFFIVVAQSPLRYRSANSNFVVILPLSLDDEKLKEVCKS